MNLKVFDYQENQVRVAFMDQEPWFVVKDVIGHLGLGNVTEAMRRLDEDEFSSTEVIDSLGWAREVSAECELTSTKGVRP